jgi:hypothetical protein
MPLRGTLPPLARCVLSVCPCFDLVVCIKSLFVAANYADVLFGPGIHQFVDFATEHLRFGEQPILIGMAWLVSASSEYLVGAFADLREDLHGTPIHSLLLILFRVELHACLAVSLFAHGSLPCLVSVANPLTKGTGWIVMPRQYSSLVTFDQGAHLVFGCLP